MRVLTVDSEKLKTLCGELERLVAQGGYVPDAVVSVATGGTHVGALMFPDVPHFEALCQRPLTPRKENGALRKVLRKMPYWVLDALRILESLGYRLSPGGRQPEVVLPEMEEARRILVVDDAVDSGVTLKAVTDALAKRFPDAEIRSAVLTVTTPKPVQSSLFHCSTVPLFHNGTLMRFPWSSDYKQ